MTCEMIQFHDACTCVKEGIFQNNDMCDDMFL